MKVLMINGSPHPDGNTARGLKEMVKVFDAEGIESEIITVGNREIRGCMGCGQCGRLGKCVMDDLVNEIARKFEAADGLVLGSPVYYGSPNGTLLALADRLFFSTHFSKAMKVGAAVTVARRAGNTATFDALNKYFALSSMPIATSQYWNMLHGLTPGEVEEDPEGLQTMRTLAKNMSFLMKAIALGKEAYGLPEYEKIQFTNFVR